MNYVIQYTPLDSVEVRSIVIPDCSNAPEAIEKFTEEHGPELAARILSVMPSTL